MRGTCAAVLTACLAGAATSRASSPVTQSPVNPSAPAQAAVTPSSIRERLTRLSTDVFAHPERLADSIRELKVILAASPRSAEAHMLLGAAYSGLGTRDMTGEAIAELRQALALEPALTSARFYLANVYLALGRVDRARDELQQALVDIPGQPQFLASLGEAERRLGQPQRAVDLLQQALAADPSFAEARYYLARAWIDLGQRDQAIQALDGLVASGAAVVDVYLTLGTAQLDAGRVDKGLDALGQGLQLAPGRVDLRIQLARALRLKGRLDDAERLIDATRPEAEALQDPEYARQIDVGLSLEQGLVRQAMGRLDAAVTAFKAVIDADPDHAPAHRHLAEVYLQQGHLAEARDEAARAAALGAPVAAATARAIDAGRQPGGKGSPR
jgi:tetratricopeptide (TPR) repeat protein